MKTLYDILGVNKHATRDEIIKAYYKKAKECHPDSGGTQELFLELNKAYKILSDTNKRNEYDKFGSFEEEESIDALAIETVNAFMSSFIQQLGVLVIKKDLIKMLTDKFQELIQKENSHKLELSNLKVILSSTKSRMLKVSNETPDYFEYIIKTELENIDKSIQSYNRQIDIYNKCIDILSKYVFRFDN